MQKSSLDELKGQIAAGQYAIDASILAGDILSKFALIRRVARLLVGEDEQGEPSEAGRGPEPRTRRGSRPVSPHRLQPRRGRLQ